MIAIFGTSDQPCWLAEDFATLLFLLRAIVRSLDDVWPLYPV